MREGVADDGLIVNCVINEILLQHSHQTEGDNVYPKLPEN